MLRIPLGVFAIAVLSWQPLPFPAKAMFYDPGDIGSSGKK